MTCKCKYYSLLNQLHIHQFSSVAMNQIALISKEIPRNNFFLFQDW